MTLRTKSIYEPAQPRDGLRVLITRYYPRGVKKDRFDRWAKELSPSRELLAEYRGGQKDWDQFRASFIEELRASPESLQALRSLFSLSNDHDVTLLCYEKEGQPCHRLVVRDILASQESLSKFLVAGSRGHRRESTGRRPSPKGAKHS